MSTKKNNRKKTFYLKSAVAAIVLSFVFGIFSGLESNALLDLNRVFTVSGRDFLIKQRWDPGIRDDDRCYSSASTLSTVIDKTGLNRIFKSNLNIDAKAGLVNSIVRLPIYDWDFSQVDTLTNEYARKASGFIGKNFITAPDPVTGFDGIDKIKAARPVGYAKDFDFTLTPVPSLSWLRGIISDPASLASINGKVANPLLYQQASIIGPNGLPKFRLTGLNNAINGKSFIKDLLFPGGMTANGVKNLKDKFPKKNGNIISYQDYVKNITPNEAAKYLANAVNEMLKRSRIERHGLFPTLFKWTFTDEEKYIYLLMPNLARQAVDEAVAQRRSEGKKNEEIFGNGARQTARLALDKINPIVQRLKPEYLNGHSHLNYWFIRNIYGFVNSDSSFNSLYGDVIKDGYLSELGQDGNAGLGNIIKGSQSITDELNNIVGGLGFNSGKNINSIRNAINNISNLRNDLKSSVANVSYNATNDLYRLIIGLMSDIFGVTGAENYQVRGDRREDTCYESLLSKDSEGRYPAYAFSVVDKGINLTIPGLLYSIQTLLVGKGLSHDGISLYLPGSINGKDMIDCYGRGQTWTMYASNRYMIGNNHQNVQSIIGAILSIFGMADPVMREVAIWQSIGTAIEIYSKMPTLLDNVPVPLTRPINYYNGMFNIYRIPKDSVRLPDSLADREIDWDKSKIIWMDGISDGNFFSLNAGENKSTNSSTYFPNLYLVLKKPHHLQPDISQKINTPDGHTGVVKVGLDKGGYNYNGGKYNKGGDKGGPMKDSKIRLIETVVKPGYYAGEIRDNDFEQSKGNLKHTNGNSVNGLTKGEICKFYKDKLGDGMSDCDDGQNDNPTPLNVASPFADLKPGVYSVSGGENVNKIPMGTVNRYIPSETPPGTKFCYSLYIEKKDNDLKYKGERYYKDQRNSNYNEKYHADREKRFLSKAYCIVSGYKPSLQVRGGDAIINGNVDTDTNRKNRLNTTDEQIYGSWSEYGLLVKGSVSGGKMASGALYRVGYKPTGSFDYDPHGYLTFSNEYTSAYGGTPNYGNLMKDNIGNGVARLQAFFALRESTAYPQGSNGCVSGNTINLKNCSTGDYALNDNTEYTVDGTDFNKDENKKKSLVFFVGNNSRIVFKNNVELPEKYDTVGDLSQIVFTPRKSSGKYTVNIKPEATRIDSWILNPNGVINTCSYGTGQDRPRSYIKNKEEGGDIHPCYSNQLTINGPVAVKQIFLRRSGGIDQNQNPPFDLKQSISGETFNLRPDAYLWALNQVSDSGRKFTTTNLIDLPPRY